MLRTLLAALLLVGLLPVAGCDGGEPAPDPETFGAAVPTPDGFGVDIRVVDAAGQPLADVPVYARIPWGREVDRPSDGAGESPLMVYPNPFLNVSLARLSIGEAGPASVRVYDLEGGEVATLLDEEVGAGERNVPFWGTVLPDGGVYVVRLETGGEVFETPVLRASDHTGAWGEGTYEVALGRTGADGRLVIEDRARFPGLYDLELVRVTFEGDAAGTFTVGSAVEFVAHVGPGLFTVPVAVRDSVLNPVTITAD